MRAAAGAHAHASGVEAGARTSLLGFDRQQQDLVLIGLIAALVAAVATFIAVRGDAIYGYGDAASHVYIARRLLDSQTPSFAQLGTNWLPALHVLMLPFVHTRALLTTGLAGSIVGGAAFVASAVLLADTAYVLTRYRRAAWFAGLALIANPSLLYLQATPMTESLMVASMAWIAHSMARWATRGSAGLLLILALSGMVAVTVRYEGWVLVGAITFAVVLWEHLHGPVADRVNRAEAHGVAVAAPGAFAGLLWIYYNWQTFGDPMSFLTGEFSSAYIIATQFGEISTKGSLPQSLLAYGSAVFIMCGLVISLLAIASIAALTLMRGVGAWAMVMLVLLVPVPFNVYSMFTGASIVWTPWNEDQYFNVRYAILMLPACVLAPALLLGQPVFGRSRRAAIALAVTALLLQTGVFAYAGIDRIAAVQDYRNATFSGNSSTSVIRESTARWARTYDGGDVLIDMRLVAGPMQLFVNVAGIPNRRYINADNYLLWDEALADPMGRARWLVDPSGLAGRESVITQLLHRGEVAQAYTLVYDEAGIRVYRRIAD